MPSSLKLSTRPAFAGRRLNDPSAVVVSTYQLDTETGTDRSGSLCLISTTADGLELKHEIPTSAGVFRFEYRNPSTIIAALTDGSLAIHQLDDPYPSDNIPVSSKILLDVSLSDSSLTATTDNEGYAYIVDLDTSTVVSSWKAHTSLYEVDGNCETWSCAIDKKANIVATGAEDALLKLWDARTRTSIGQCKVFEAGVTFIDWFDDKSSGEDEGNLLLAGSYDEYVRIIDRRNMKKPVQETKLSGGVWNLERTNDLDGTGGTFVAACMYGGYAILDDKIQVVKSNEAAGKNLLYAATAVDGGKVVYATFNDWLVSLDDI